MSEMRTVTQYAVKRVFRDITVDDQIYEQDYRRNLMFRESAAKEVKRVFDSVGRVDCTHIIVTRQVTYTPWT